MTEEERAGKSESLFREVNERIDDLSATASSEEVFLCECSARACAEQLVVPDAVYDDVRSRSTWFLIRPGHENPEVERVVARQPGYLIVEKHGEAAEQAKPLDPRARGE